jgi:hypothetical protein
MRELQSNELIHVSGAGGSCSCTCPPTKRAKGNNGFGNGADANLAAPGNSGKTGGGKEGSVGDDRGPR